MRLPGYLSRGHVNAKLEPALEHGSPEQKLRNKDKEVVSAGLLGSLYLWSHAGQEFQPGKYFFFDELARKRVLR